MNTCICFDNCHKNRFYSELLRISRANYKISSKNYVPFDACLRTVHSGRFYFNIDLSLLPQDDSLPDKTSDGVIRKSSDRDLHDTFSLFKLYTERKMDNLESRLAREKVAMSWRIKEFSIKFKHEGNNFYFK